MATPETPPEVLTRATTATTRRTTVRLDELKFDLDRYYNRSLDALLAESLTILMDSLVLEGLQVPIEYFVDEKGNKVLLKGHRRVKACQILAGKNEAGFTEDMGVEAIEVTAATPVDRLMRSASDNEVRLNLDRNGRIRLTKKLHDAGAPTERAARAMGVSTKTYERDLLIARNNWMFQHVVDGSIAATHAVALLEEARKAGRAAEMREDLDAWIAGKKAVIREKERMRKARDGKELSPADRLVKKYLPNHLVTHWVDLLRAGKRFDEDAEWDFAAGIEAETERLHISSLTIHLTKTSLDRLAKVGGKLARVAKQLGPYLRKAKEREDAEAAAGAEDTAESPYDLDYLRELGLENVAETLAAKTQPADAGGEETPPEEPAAREERDLTAEVGLPESAPEPGDEPAAPAEVPPPPPAPAPAAPPRTPPKPEGKEKPRK